MADHAIVCELNSNQDNASLGLPPAFVQTGEANRIVVNGGGSNWTSDPLPVPIIPPSGHGPTSGIGSFPSWPYVYKVIGMAEGQPALEAPPPASVPVGPHAGIFAYASETGEYFWQISGVAFSNGLVSPMQPVQSGTAGRISRPDQLAWSNDAGTALATGASPSFAHVHIEYRYPRINPYQNLSHFLEFADVPPDSISGIPVTESQWNVPGALNRLATALANAPGRVNLGNVAGQPVFVNNCNFTGIAPEGAVYIEPSDYGGAAEDRIPTEFQNNEASRFRFHPSVFLRRAAYYNGITAPYADPEPINEATASFDTQVMRIVTVDANPLQSNWLVITDGAPQVLNLLHPVGSDLRRPRDIWNEVWVPLLEGSNAVANAVQARLYQPTVGAAVSNAINVVKSRLQFAEYFRCLPLAGTEQNQGQPT